MGRRRLKIIPFPFWPIACLFVAGLAAGGSPIQGQVSIPVPLASELLTDDVIQQVVPGQATDCCLRPGDQMWLISTRCFSDCDSGQVPQVYNVMANTWQTSDIQALQAECSANPHTTTVVYVHGNFSDFGWSKTRGCQVYTNLYACQSSGPIRYIIWSWSSERTALPPCDFGIKNDRSFVESHRLNRILGELNLNRPVLIGYSLGVQVILAAATLPAASTESSQANWNVALIAPVFDQQLICCMQCNSDHLRGRIDQVLLITNCEDRVVKNTVRYFRIKYRGPVLNQYSLAQHLACHSLQLRVCEVSAEMRKQHSIDLYTKVPAVIAEINALTPTTAAEE